MVRLIPWMLLLLLMTFLPYILCLNQEGYALMAFKNSLQEDPLNVTSNWDTTQQNPCSWNGITCQQNKVVSLTIPRRQLLGLLPSILGSLTYLRHINLRNNNLNGTIPYELFRIMGLQSLILYGNFFSGSIPADIGNMEFIQVLDLSQNHLNGSIPSSLMKCTRLRSLVLSHNNFSGALDNMFGSNFDELQTLDLSFNRLEGEIPSGIGNLSHVQTPIDLSHNSFSGSIPSSLGHIPENVYIDLSYNNLSGAIPQNGTLVNRGPTAFLENPGLCGPPLKNPCSGVSSAILNLPSSFAPQTGVGFLNPSTLSKGLSRGVVIAIVLSDVFGIVVIAMVFMLCYWRLASSRGKDDLSEKKRRKECLCFRKDESDTRSENMEQQDLIPLDVQVGFDLDELLRASAFVLGKSGIGIVYKVVLDDGLTLAVRRLGEGGSQRFKEFQTEVEAIGRIRHQNIVTLRAYYWSSDEKLLIYDYIQNGNLATAIHGKDSPPLLWEVRMGIVKGVAKGLAYLHEYSPKKYVHGDIKPTNILLGLNMEPYISDFGLGRLANIAGSSSADQSNRVVAENKTPPQAFGQAINLVANPGTLYQAPEAPKLLKPSQKWDVYSYGVILLELITGRSPEVLLSMSEIDLVKWVQVCIDEKKPFSEVLDPVLLHELEMEDQMVGVLKIALACVQVNSERRPSMRNISDVLDRLSTSN